MKVNLSQILIFLLGMVICGIPVAVSASDPIVVVVTGTMLPSEVSTSPSLVEVIEVEPKNDLVSVGDLLNEVPGVELHQSTPFPGGVSTVSIWGSQSSQVLILVDGVRLNSSQSGSYDLSLLPLEAIERIEIQKGSSSSIYGTSAIGGVINIITKKGYKAGSSLRLEVGSWGQQESTLTSQGELAADTYYALNLGYRLGEGYLDHSAYTSGDLYASVTRDLDPFSSVNISALAIDNQSEIPAVGESPEADKQSNRLGFQGRYIREDDDGSFIEAVLWRDVEQMEYQDYDPMFPTYSKHLSNAIGYNLVRSWVKNDATLSVATDGRFDKVNSTEFDSTKRISNYGLNAEVKAPLAMGWEALAVGRVDYHSQFGAHFSPRIGLVKSALGGLIKLNVGSAFKAPTASDLYWEGFGNPGLEPERAWSVEAQYLSESRAGSQWGVSGFYRKVDDLINWAENSSGIYQPQNISQVEVVGAELSASHQIRSDISAKVYATILSATGYDKQVSPLVPLEYGVSLQYQPSDKLNGTLKLTGAGERYNGLAAYTTVDLGVHYQLRPGVRVQASLTNLFDEEYQLVASYPMPGRQFKAGISCSF